MSASKSTENPPPGDTSNRFTEFAVIAALILVVLIGAVTLLGERFSGEKQQTPTSQSVQ